MDQNTLLLKASDLFVDKYPDFPYLLKDIHLWAVTEDEYQMAFQNAAKRLNLPIKSTTYQLKQYSIQLRAELLKTPAQAIIILHKSLLEAPNESLRIVLHELAHAYHDSMFENTPPTDNVMYFLFQIGERMWKECAAEYFSAKVLQLEETWSQSVLEREFKSLLYDPSLYPERLGFFFMKCRATCTSSVQVAEVVGIRNETVAAEKLIEAMDGLQNILVSGLEQSATLRADSDFLVQLGIKIVNFVYCYYQFYNHTETFLNQIKG